MTTHLVCGSETFEVRMQVLINLSLFQECPELLKEGYRVKLTTDAGVFREFLNAASGDGIKLNDRNVLELCDLCREFGFQELQIKIDEYMRTHPGPGDAVGSKEEKISN